MQEAEPLLLRTYKTRAFAFLQVSTSRVSLFLIVFFFTSFVTFIWVKSCCHRLCTCHCTVSYHYHPTKAAVLIGVLKYFSPTMKVLEACHFSSLLAPIFRCVVLLAWCMTFTRCSCKSMILKHVPNTVKSLLLHGWPSWYSTGIPHPHANF